ncbi:MAG: lipoyl synthase [Muribaculaceae bacterium]|nr:lipoyl synthase [Muribaculaceae bacterium]
MERDNKNEVREEGHSLCKETSDNSRSRADFRRKPDWLKIKLPRGFKTSQVLGLLNEKHIHTICSSGMCPNRAECWGSGTATFMIGGNICTRNCRFCNVPSGRPLPLNPGEIEDIVESVKELRLRHVVITSVDRDDLPDLGAGHWARMIRSLKGECPGVTMEVLIPDFQGREDLLDMVIAEHPDVISHNLETVRRLTPEVRTFATYDNSLKVVGYVSSHGIRSKSGIMLGLGETRSEVLETMDDLLRVGCEVMTIGQYLQPAKTNYTLREYIHPDVFAEYGRIGKEKGFRHIESSPMVRSSYHAEKHVY